ncbi:MAG TPA: hypothetical protein VEJ87_10060 [Acidimicrobiales bacterium]|nr:hypothetical protein [Acidimicrobiales bacterium]
MHASVEAQETPSRTLPVESVNVEVVADELAEESEEALDPSSDDELVVESALEPITEPF